MGEFSSIVGLDRLRRITKVDDGTFGEVNGRITALLLVGIDKALSGCLINHGTQEEAVRIAETLIKVVGKEA